MPKYTQLLTRTEYEQLTADARIEYILDIAEALKATRQTPKAGIPLREAPDREQTNSRFCSNS